MWSTNMKAQTGIARIAGVAVLGVLAWGAVHAQQSPAPNVPMKTTYVPLGNNANAIIVEPATPDAARSRIAVLVKHPERLNTFNYFIGRELSKRGYRVMMLNYYGAEQTYEEFLTPIAAAVRHLRSLPGVQEVVFAGHSTGGPELTSYQDVAENGPKACQGPERIYPCRGNNLANLPKADGVMLLDSNAGAPERTIALDPAAGRHPRERNPELDMFSPHNGFNEKANSATYSSEFLRTFMAAQGARANRLIDEALARLAKIEKGEGDYKDDEPFVVSGTSLHVNGARLELADLRLRSKTHAPHPLLKADGTTPMQIVPLVMPPAARPDQQERLDETTMNVTVRHYLSFQALRTTAAYALAEEAITGIEWRTTPNSVPGNVEGIRVPTLVMSATCADHLVFSEIAFDRSAAKDKAFVGVEGANHNFQPCKPEYGDTSKRAFDYVDGWLLKPGRF
jgi:hypothetical protein